MAARGFFRSCARLNGKRVSLNSVQTCIKASQNGATPGQKQLHTVFQSCQAASVLNKKWPVKQYRTVTSCSIEETENNIYEEDSQGDFDNFDISDVTKEKLRKMGIQKLFPVQYHTFQPTLEGRDVIVQARTGTGKTLSFALPIVESLQQNSRRFKEHGRKPLVIVLTPTRELAVQVTEVFNYLCDRAKVTSVYGGVSIERQIDAIQTGVDVIVGTPGRIIDLIKRRALDLSQLKHVILDEVDRMLDMGFDVQVEEIIKDSYQAVEKPQTMLYSATVPGWVRKAAKQYLSDDYKMICLVDRSDEQTAVTVKQYAMKCKELQKPALINYLLKKYVNKGGRAIIFCETKLEVNELVQNDLGMRCKAFHGDISQSSRNVILKEFKNSVFEVLITTDVAARGLDIPNIDLVIQKAPPKDTDYYIHRVGRTGRAGKSGLSILLYSSENVSSMESCQRQAQVRFESLRPPTLNDLFAMCAKSVTSEVLSAPDDLSEKFSIAADMLIKENGAQKMLAAALAVASDAKRYYNRSLMTFQEGYTTLLYTCDRSRDSRELKGNLYRYLKMLSVSYKNFHLVKDFKGVVFDVKVDDVATFLNEFNEVRSEDSEMVKKIDELPNIIESGFETSNRQAGRSYDRYSYGQRNRNSFEHRSSKNSRLHEAFGPKSSRYGHHDMYDNKKWTSYDDNYRSNFHNKNRRKSRDVHDMTDDEFF